MSMINTYKKYDDLVNLVRNEVGYDDKVEITFTQPINIRVNSSKIKNTKNIKVKLFVSDNGILAYTFYKKSGFAFESEWVDKIKSLEVVKRNADEEKNNKISQLINLINSMDENVWPDVQKEVKSGNYRLLNNHHTKNLKTANIKKIFNSFNYNRIVEAFENKKNLVVCESTSKRDHKVEMVVSSDGTIKAWYSSEFSGMMNGDYYILVNPNKALFVERD